MKKILVTALLVGAATAALIIYLMDEYDNDELDNVEDAADGAYTTMNRDIGRAERRAERGFDSVLG